MSFAIEPQTPTGGRLCALAESLIPVLRERAALADSTGEVCEQNFLDLQSTGIAAAFVPEELGGLGLESIHDWILNTATLARGDGSTAIAINMHLGVSRGMVAAYRAAQARSAPTDGHATLLKAIATGNMLICATATEAGTDNLHPMTEAVRTYDGWTISGRKMFVTMSPIATHLAMNLRVRDSEGDHLANTMVPVNTPGIEQQNDWDALGMRASGSQSIRFDDVKVPEGAVRKLAPWGRWSTSVLVHRTVGNLSLVGAFLGIAEHAREIAIAAVNKQQRLGQPINTRSGIQTVVGEMEIELAQCRSILAHAGRNMDTFFQRYQDETPTLAAAHEIMRDYQCAKWVVNRGAINIVSQAMDLVGGGGFMAGHPLTRLYRDVRAGPFMQPLAVADIREHVGMVSLGILPES